MTRRSTIGSANGTLSLRRATVLRRFQMFNARQGRFAIGTFGASRLFVNALCLQNTTRCTHATQGMRRGIVGMTALAGPTIVGHDGESIKSVEIHNRDIQLATRVIFNSI